ncbi:flagellar rod protein FlaI [Photobacterium jeanii]|uniref:Flagellar rod protein FlaI n=1 Tax=Photobacterium jeanii TaxID=858640 RepID=A0A178KMK5_9GAMM|nr:flagellar rod protein FlaI [Photobacterium jeanii]OAN18618.1 flagellar rod protein FlaI [Photobacterium jeanii]PST91702.1 flagellar rod protein FlaI [Photobacterium jeanii]
MQQLDQLDQQLASLLTSSAEVDAEQLQQLLQQRETLLQTLMAQPEQLDQQQWQAAVERTSLLLEQIRQHRERSASELQRLQHGQRSMQIYNKFR